jgi:predicted membrane-bound spermidine synthase
MKEDALIRRKQLWVLLSAIFLTSICVIAFEITLSRLLSVLLSYHYVFVVLSLALLGLGAGGMFVYFFRPQLPIEENRFLVLSFVSSMFSLTIPFSAIFIIQVEYVDDIQIAILFYCFVLVVPFFLAGVLLAEIYRMFPAVSTMIYGADLIGAAAGSFISIPLLNILGGISTNLVLGAMASLAAVFFALGDMRKNNKGLIISALSFSILSVLFALNLVGGLQLDIHIGANPTKEIYDALSSFKGKIVETKWSPFGRTDLVEFSNYPDHMDIYIDGTAGSPMYRFNGNVNDPGATINKIKNSFPGYFPFLHLQEKERNNALVIGPGGGRDILLMLMGGVQKVTAVEINRDLVNMVRRYSWFNGGIYTDLDNVTIVVDEGRSFLRRQKEKYDIVMLSLPVTNTSRSLEGYALTENFIFTTDSINDYLDHLTDEGRLVVIGHNDAEILRLLSLSLAALHKRGVNIRSGMNQIYIAGSDEYLVFVLKKTPFEPMRVLPMYKALHRFGLESTLSYFPYIRQAGAINPALMALANGKIVFEDFVKMVKERGYDISPVTDDSPFFYKFEVGTPKPVSVVFWSSVILLVIIILIPPLYWKREATQREALFKKKGFLDKGVLRSVALFSMLGMGFMLIEISLIQRFVLFLGYPVLSLAVLLGSLLGGAGIGSLWSGRFGPDKTDRGIAMTSLSIVVMILCYTFLLPMVFDQLLGLDLVIRVLASIFILIPIGFLMGIPFPLGIRWLKESSLENHIPWMWGINGVSSVLGSVMTIVVAISFGFTEVLLLSGGCYFIVFLIFIKSKI